MMTATDPKLPPSGHDSPPRDTLRGIRVLDFTAMMAGPYCARWLSDLGAEVIKLEPPEGDYMRTRAPSRGGFSAYYGHLNAGKKSIVVDLKHPEGVALARQLADGSDIILEAFRPGVMDRLGLGADTLRSRNPRLIYCSISGFGQKTSVAGYPAYAYVVQAASGFDIANFEYQDGADRPANSGIPMADIVTAVFAAFSVQTALLRRERSGLGCTIDVNLMDSMMNLLPCELQAAQFPLPERRPLYKPLKARDGFILVAPVNEKNFRSVCTATGHPEWREDPLLNSDKARYDNWAEYMNRIERWASERSASECERLLMEAGVPCSRYKRIEEAMEESQFRERGSFGIVHDGAGSYQTINLPFSMDGEKPVVRPDVSSLGQQTAEVLSTVLGLTARQIEDFGRKGVVGGV
jgi:crotonobetainyl-CoA:carnitine CoA-transferase CaiB-like acyl-CoA transferase